MRCQCLVSNLLRRYVGKCGEYVVVKVRRSHASCVLFVSVFCLSGNLEIWTTIQGDLHRGMNADYFPGDTD